MSISSLQYRTSRSEIVRSISENHLLYYGNFTNEEHDDGPSSQEHEIYVPSVFEQTRTCYLWEFVLAEKQASISQLYSSTRSKNDLMHVIDNDTRDMRNISSILGKISFSSGK